MTYAEKLRDPRWQRKRLIILQRDQFACRDCGNSHNELQVHHCFYSRCEPWEIADEMLLTVCGVCHKTRQDMENELKFDVSRIIARLSKNELVAFSEAVKEAADHKQPWPVIVGQRTGGP